MHPRGRAVRREERTERVSKEIHGRRSEGRERTAEVFLGDQVKKKKIEAGHSWSSIKPHIHIGIIQPLPGLRRPR